MIKTVLSHCRLYVLCAMMLFVIRGVAQVGTTAERFDMPYHVNSMSLSSDSSYICMTFMQSGRTARYGIFDLKSRQLTWMSETMDTERGRVVPTRYGLLVMHDWGLLWNISLIDAQRGTATWTEPGVGGFRYAERTDMALAVKKNVREPGLILKAFNVSNGDTLWRYRINHEFVQGMNGGMYSVSDTVALVIADQLCLVSRGQGNIDYCSYDTPQQGADLPTMITGNKIYVSDRKHLKCYDKWLEEIWSASHPAAAHARLQRIGKRLCLINEGYVKKVLPPDNTGVSAIVNQQVCKPFIAFYDRETGKRQSLAYLDWKPSDGTLERILVNAVFYVKQEGSDGFRKVVTPSDGCFVKVNDGTIYVLDEKMKIKEKYTDDKVFHRYFHTSRCIGISSVNDAYIATPEGKPLYHLPQGTNAVCRVGNEVFYTVGDTLYWQPLP